ncbi:MAG: energy coupling factor transporter S component ThiW [Tuberibacillus sp.]
MRALKPIQKMTLSSLLIAIGTVTGQLIYIPIGISKIFPVQHFINVVAAVILGPSYSVICAFLISLLRNLFGTGSVLAFPGSMIGAYFAGLAFRKTNKIGLAALGEVFGTGAIGAIVCYPIAKFLFGMNITAFYFVLPFSFSTIAGSLVAYVSLRTFKQSHMVLKKTEKWSEHK